VDNSILIQHRGALVDISLNRPHVLNALNDEMRAAIAEGVPRFSRDPEVYAMLMRSTSARAFCAGGDVRELTRLAKQDPALARASIGAEYAMNWALECFTKPTVSLIDGIAMGSGVGLVLYGTHRVAGERFSLAMPETAIGLFPDVGVSCVLAKLPGHMGRYLGLTGRSIRRAMAYRMGLVTHCIDASHHHSVITSLEAADPVDPVLDDLHETPPQTPDDVALAARASLIEDVFSGATVPEIFAALESKAAGLTGDAEWCATVLAELKTKSPLALAITLRHLDHCRDLDLRNALIRDYRLAYKILAEQELQEGVRAVLVDKDGQPKWRHQAVDLVNLEEIDMYFESIGEAELILHEREKMQRIQG